jgi:hypothetical protein
MILQNYAESVIRYDIEAPIFKASGQRIFIAVYKSHYVRLQRDYQTLEWCKIERYPFDPNEPLPFEHPVHQSFTDRYHIITPAQFMVQLEGAVMFMHSNYFKTPMQ